MLKDFANAPKTLAPAHWSTGTQSLPRKRRAHPMSRKQHDIFQLNAPLPNETADLHKAIRTILELMQEPELGRPRQHVARGTRLIF